MDFDTAKKATEETEKLQITRRDFEKLKNEEEIYLREREEQVRLLLKDFEERIIQAEKELNFIGDEILKRIRNLREIQELFGRGLSSLLEKADKMFNQTENAAIKAQAKLKEIDKGTEQLKNLVKENSQREQSLKQRESAVDKKLKTANQKLERAKELAYWHKEPNKIYKEE